MIFDFRFLALLAVAGSLAGSVLCFLNVSDMVLHALLLPLSTPRLLMDLVI